jgi:hypothetical protein
MAPTTHTIDAATWDSTEARAVWTGEQRHPAYVRVKNDLDVSVTVYVDRTDGSDVNYDWLEEDTSGLGVDSATVRTFTVETEPADRLRVRVVPDTSPNSGSVSVRSGTGRLTVNDHGSEV